MSFGRLFWGDLSGESLWAYVLRQCPLGVEGVWSDLPLGDLWGSTSLPLTIPGSSWRSPLDFHLVDLWSLAVLPTIGFWLSGREKLLLLHRTAKATLCMGSGGCRSLRAGRCYGRWESVTFSMFFLTWRCRGCLSFLFSSVALGICRGRMLASETVMAVELVCLLRHSSPAGWLARLHWQSNLLAC